MMAALANEDRVPHDRAVWREGHMPAPSAILARVPVCIDRGGLIETTTADAVDWTNVGRWRFGWPPA